VAQPGYVQLVIGAEAGLRGAKAACRQLAKICREECVNGALVLFLAAGPAVAQLQDHLPLAMQALSPGFRLAVVSSCPAAAPLAAALADKGTACGAVAKVFPSEHRAAAWLMS
jgi:hypothetical protein